ncbi:MAG: hypothetical protein WAL40_03620 [Rhodoplanes sp.]
MAAEGVRRGEATGARRRAGYARRLLLPVLSALAVAGLAIGFVVYALWPRWPEAAPAADAPHLPIVIAGETFQVPPAAVRRKVQRRPGPQERVDLVFTWPALAPPAPSDDKTAVTRPERLFVSIAARDGAAEPAERLRTIYLRYAAAEPSNAPEGLTVTAFRDGTPYQGEDLVYDESAPEHFVARCTRSAIPLAPASCLLERFVGKVNVTVRFPREWLADWRAFASGLDRLIAELHPKRAG